MSQQQNRLRTGLLCVVMAGTALTTGCPGLIGGSGSRPEGYRLIDGELELPQTGIVGRQVTGLQMVAVAVRETNAGPIPDVFVSSIFNPAQRTSASEFVIAADSINAVHLVLQVPGSGQGPGEFLGRLLFDNGRGELTSLIPAGSFDISLGAVAAVENAPETAADNVLVIDSGNNPLGQVDSDLDSLSDLIDDDDDDDGQLDANDSDVAGDGIDDVNQAFESFEDADANGIPDAFES